MYLMLGNATLHHFLVFSGYHVVSHRTEIAVPREWMTTTQYWGKISEESTLTLCAFTTARAAPSTLCAFSTHLPSWPKYNFCLILCNSRIKGISWLVYFKQRHSKWSCQYYYIMYMHPLWKNFLSIRKWVTLKTVVLRKLIPYMLVLLRERFCFIL